MTRTIAGLGAAAGFSLVNYSLVLALALCALTVLATVPALMKIAAAEQKRDRVIPGKPSHGRLNSGLHQLPGSVRGFQPLANSDRRVADRLTSAFNAPDCPA
ncbi:MAG: hypothetical protein H7Y20_11125 [Bryobacteraceae bacterium]|nr:hypothetical protein [Bryobacteraceae bacterium]